MVVLPVVCAGSSAYEAQRTRTRTLYCQALPWWSKRDMQMPYCMPGNCPFSWPSIYQLCPPRCVRPALRLVQPPRLGHLQQRPPAQHATNIYKWLSKCCTCCSISDTQLRSVSWHVGTSALLRTSGTRRKEAPNNPPPPAAACAGFAPAEPGVRLGVGPPMLSMPAGVA